MYAHLSKKLGWVLIINDSARPIGGAEYQVSGKKEARMKTPFIDYVIFGILFGIFLTVYFTGV